MGTPSDWELLAPHLTPERRARLEEVLAARSGAIRLVAENLYDPYNLSAILRTADAFGVQHLHLTGSAPQEIVSTVALGSERWLTVAREGPTLPCLERLKAEGFCVAAAALRDGAVDPLDWEPTGPVALVVGNEHDGLEPPTLEAADVVLRIPLSGFARSLNVSVATALLLHALSRKAALRDQPLPEAEREALRQRWAVLAVKRGEEILHRLRRRQASGVRGQG